MKDDAANFPDPADRASQEEEFSLELRARDRERKLIKKIDKTLQLIEDEEYGWCESCGVEIGVKRLEARPTADMCVDCKTLAEIKEKQVGKYSPGLSSKRSVHTLRFLFAMLSPSVVSPHPQGNMLRCPNCMPTARTQ
jgi:DnaK suppressor protein